MLRSWPKALIVASALCGIGWASGRAQAPPAFEIAIDAPEGETKVECVRGCTLYWVQRGAPTAIPADRAFRYACSGASRCSSGRIGGWIDR